MVFFYKITIYNILGLLLGTSCDIFGKNANYKIKKHSRMLGERSRDG
jgi:ferritin-like protein